MDKETLAVLEEAIEPYRRAGFVVTSQSESAITLTLPTERFSFALFIILFLIWPLAVLYLVYYYTRSEKSVCLRITSQGNIEVSGYTLEDIVRERRHRKIINRLVFVLTAVIILLILLLTYLSRTR